ncbi:hypothetical protein ACFQAS_04735 [Halopenitus salinus]|uniref:Uncharacterized protein n=1 Tax=Halopenitus salinus TaxID=1198295 RepID=A0ABD5UV57_9EURY
MAKRRQFLRTTTVGLGCVLAGCSAIGSSNKNSDSDQPSNLQKFENDTPKDPVVIEARFARSESTEADLRAALDIISIPPSGKYGSVNLVLDAVSDFTPFSASVDTLHHVDSDGFEEIRQGIWKWNGQSNAPNLTVDIEIGERAGINYGTYESTVFASYGSHVHGVPASFNAQYRPNDELDIPDGATTDIPVEIDIMLEDQGFGSRHSEAFVVFGPHERVRLSDDDFELYTVGLPDFFPDGHGPVAIARSLHNVRQTLRLGGGIKKAHGWTIPQENVAGRAYGTEDDIGEFTATRDLGTWFHEYLHLEQQFNLGDDLIWFKEASATYFEELVGLYLGSFEYSRFYRFVSNFSWSEAVSDISDPTHAMAYGAGALLGALDAEIRTSSGDTTLAAVFRSMNDYNGTISYDLFADFVAEAAGERLDGWLEENVLEPASTSVPNDPKLFLNRDQYDIPQKYELKVGEVEHHTVGIGGNSESPTDSQVSWESEPSETAKKSLAKPVVQYINALDRNNFDAATAVTHSEAKTNFKSTYNTARNGKYVIQTIDVDIRNKHYVVSLMVVFKNKESDGSITFNWDIEMMKENSQWKLYRII